MKRLIKQNNDIKNLISDQIYNSENKYRSSTFTLLVPYNDCYILFNIFTKEAILLTFAEKTEFIDKFNIYKPECKYLIKKWFFVPNDYDELSLYNQFFDVYNLLHKKSIINNFTILTTTDCNARCFYCYQKGIKHEYMSNLVANDTVNYIHDVCKNSKVNITWFGGEPLINTQAIDIISDGLSNKNVEFTSSMISNGYLFDNEMIEKAKTKWNLKRVQITIDGTEEIYNKSKSYVYKGINAFKTVMDNIENLLKADISVAIRVNIGLHNVDDIYKLLDEIDKRFSNKEKLFVAASALYEYLEADFERRSLVLNELLQFDKLLYEKGFLVVKDISKIKKDSCMADSDNSVLITPTGKLSKCEHHIYDEICGDIYNGITQSDVVRSWKVRKSFDEQCGKCAFLPNCIRLQKCQTKASDCDDLNRALFKIQIENSLIYRCKKEKDLEEIICL